MEILIVAGCGLFFLATAIIAYFRFIKDYEKELKENRRTK